MKRVLEPEVMDSPEEAIAYDAMDFTEVNTDFAKSAIAYGADQGLILDAGTGTARIPIAICQLLPPQPRVQIVGIDLAVSMLAIAARNVEQAGLQELIKLELVDAKQLPYPHGHFDMVISNSIVHHLPNPKLFLQELQRVLKPNGGIFLRDLLRPKDENVLNQLVASIGTDYDPHQTQLFRDSLHAAFTLAEITEMLEDAGLHDLQVYQSSDRHWTAVRKCSIAVRNGLWR